MRYKFARKIPHMSLRPSCPLFLGQQPSNSFGLKPPACSADTRNAEPELCSDLPLRYSFSHSQHRLGSPGLRSGPKRAGRHFPEQPFLVGAEKHGHWFSPTSFAGGYS